MDKMKLILKIKELSNVIGILRKINIFLSMVFILLSQNLIAGNLCSSLFVNPLILHLYENEIIEFRETNDIKFSRLQNLNLWHKFRDYQLKAKYKEFDMHLYIMKSYLDLRGIESRTEIDPSGESEIKTLSIEGDTNGPRLAQIIHRLQKTENIKVIYDPYFSVRFKTLGYSSNGKPNLIAISHWDLMNPHRLEYILEHEIFHRKIDSKIEKQKKVYLSHLSLVTERDLFFGQLKRKIDPKFPNQYSSYFSFSEFETYMKTIKSHFRFLINEEESKENKKNFEYLRQNYYRKLMKTSFAQEESVQRRLLFDLKLLYNFSRRLSLGEKIFELFFEKLAQENLEWKKKYSKEEIFQSAIGFKAVKADFQFFILPSAYINPYQELILISKGVSLRVPFFNLDTYIKLIEILQKTNETKAKRSYTSLELNVDLEHIGLNLELEKMKIHINKMKTLKPLVETQSQKIIESIEIGRPYSSMKEDLLSLSKIIDEGFSQ